MSYYYITIFLMTIMVLILRENFLLVSGYLAFIVLLISLSISPMKRFGMGKINPKIRKQAGICSGIIALFHATFATVKVFKFEWDVMLDSYQAYFGLAAISIYLFLLITSFKYVQSLFQKPSWKNLHRIVYILPIFILIHTYYSSNNFISYNIILVIVYFILILLKLVPRKSRQAFS